MKCCRSILVVLDNSDLQEQALQQAVLLAESNQASLTVVDVLPEVPHEMPRLMGRGWSSDFQQTAVKARQEDLEALVAEHCKDDLAVRVDVLQGTSFLEIIHNVLRHKHDLVVKTVQQQNVVARVFFGSADMRLLRKCPCPVLLVKPHGKDEQQRLLVAVDIEPSTDEETQDALNDLLLETASAVAFALSCELHIVHAWHVEGTSMLNSFRFKSQRQEVEEWIKAQSAEIKKRHQDFDKKIQDLLGDKGKEYVHLQVHMVEGHAESVIPEMAEKLAVNLVVMGTVARTGLPGLLMGNTAETILNQLKCSVLAIKPPGFQTPVTLD